MSESTASHASDQVAAARARKLTRDDAGRIGFKYRLVARRKDGSVKWVDEGFNLITNEGLAWILQNDLAAASLFVGVKNAGSVANADTMASHAGWTENQNYDEATREAITWGAVTGTTTASISNSASPATITCDTDAQTIAGAFITTNSTKGGTTGTLISVRDLASGKALDDGETLDITVTLSLTDSGA